MAEELSFRVGQAMDFHAFFIDEGAATTLGAPEAGAADYRGAESSDEGGAGRPLWLAGLEWPGEVPLEGHSDGDVAAHALCDAMLGAAGLGEMGTVFGVDRPEFAGASGAAFLGEVVRMLADAGWRLGNATVQVIGQKPRMAARLGEASARLSDLAGGSVQVSATTTDHMGFTGRGEGLAASAAALLIRV